MIRALWALSAVLLAGCEDVQRAVQSATGTDPATRCASAETYAALNQILYDRVWPSLPGSKRPNFRTIGDVARRVQYQRPVLDSVDATSGVVHCSADLVIPDAPIMFTSEAEIDLKFRQEGAAVVAPIKFDIGRTADTASTLVKLDQDAAVVAFVRAFASMTQTELLREIARSERQQQAERDAATQAANATAATPDPPASEGEAEPIDTRDETLGENHL